MANRLSSENRIAIYHQGYRAFSLGDKITTDLVPSVDLDKILEKPNASGLIKSLSSQLLYLSLKNRGIAESADIIQHLSAEQFLRIFDYDVWNKDDINHKQVALWLSLCNEVSPSHMVSRFRSLDEEYQLSFLLSIVVAYDSTQYEKLDQLHQDRLYNVAGDQLYYDVLSDDKLVHETIVKLLEACLTQDLSYAMSLLALVTYTPPHESELLLKQFRRARLEEDGFVSYEEGESHFSSLAQARKFYANHKSSVYIKPELKQLDDKLMFERAIEDIEDIERVKTSFLHLSNALCSATQIETDDTSSLRNLMVQTRGLVNVGLEYCSSSISEASELLSKKYLKNIFQSALIQIKSVQEHVISELGKYKFLNLENLDRYVKTCQYGMTLDLFDKRLIDFFGTQRVEIIKGLFNRFAMVPVFHTEDGVEKIYFKPLEKRSELENLTLMVDSYLSLLKLSNSLSKESLTKDISLDKRLLQLLSCFILEKDFSFTFEDKDIVSLQNKQDSFVKEKYIDFSSKYLSQETQSVKEEFDKLFQQLLSMKLDRSLGWLI
jgi:hypothetical protein